MAAPQQTGDPTTQTGGGASENQRTIIEINDNVLLHLRRIYERHEGPDKKWTVNQTSSFFRDVQHQDVPTQLQSYSDLDLNAFLGYMTSQYAAASKPRPHEDLSWPLASYYISSSHNTYLSGNQLSSDSTADTYENVLSRGCRCVEVDVWDGDESDVESSESSSDDERTAAKKAERKEEKKKEKTAGKRSKLGMLRDKLPDSVTSKLEKTSIGKKIDEKVANKETSTTASHGAAVPPRGNAETSEHVVKTDSAGSRPEVGMVEPRVLHGYTLTKEVSFRDVCVAIRESAFKASQLPVIVSLEVHCSAQQQTSMVSIMKETWDGMLVTDTDVEPKELPTLQQLMGKILIKVKYAPPGSSVGEEDQTDDEEGAPADIKRREAKKKGVKPKKPAKIIQELSRLGVYTKAVSFKAFDQPEASMPTHIFSLAEKKFLDFHEKSRQALMEHNVHHMLRAYPAGYRISSSNLNPAVFWSSGAQIVALNWQQTDEGMMLNEGMFAGTGGYVLKPRGYLPDIKSKVLPNTLLTKTLNLSITCFAAQAISLPKDSKTSKGFKPYVKVEVHTEGSGGKHEAAIEHEGHTQEGEYKAKTKTHKGTDVDLLEEKLHFSNISGLIEELTFVRFTVRDNEFGKDDLAAWACIRLDRLADGYRFVHLMNVKGELTKGAILVKIEKSLT